MSSKGSEFLSFFWENGGALEKLKLKLKFIIFIFKSFFVIGGRQTNLVFFLFLG